MYTHQQKISSVQQPINRKMSLTPGISLNIPQTTMEPFKDIKQIHLQWNNDITDDDMVPRGKQYTSTRIQIMITTLAMEKSAEALLKATRELMEALPNKLPMIRFAKWNDKDATRNAKHTVKQIPVKVGKEWYEYYYTILQE